MRMKCFRIFPATSRDYIVAAVELYAKTGVGQGLRNDPFYFECFFFLLFAICHSKRTGVQKRDL